MVTVSSYCRRKSRDNIEMKVMFSNFFRAVFHTDAGASLAVSALKNELACSWTISK